ncbi:hypothetical protein M231_04661 [Tremella mesenterica]|uniref:Uncharacterized protein n=1 Tax=Tremella mesenterica TaxID=5217 RepID=A0A4Q1BKJ7_TREME|nr:hypothetical protein M231_04661 [Tremella mesenterica]
MLCLQRHDTQAFNNNDYRALLTEKCREMVILNFERSSSMMQNGFHIPLHLSESDIDGPIRVEIYEMNHKQVKRNSEKRRKVDVLVCEFEFHLDRSTRLSSPPNSPLQVIPKLSSQANKRLVSSTFPTPPLTVEQGRDMDMNRRILSEAMKARIISNSWDDDHPTPFEAGLELSDLEEFRGHDKWGHLLQLGQASKRRPTSQSRGREQLGFRRPKNKPLFIADCPPSPKQFQHFVSRNSSISQIAHRPSISIPCSTDKFGQRSISLVLTRPVGAREETIIQMGYPKERSLVLELDSSDDEGEDSSFKSRHLTRRVTRLEGVVDDLALQTEIMKRRMDCLSLENKTLHRLVRELVQIQET